MASGLTLDGYQGHDTGDAITSAELLAARSTSTTPPMRFSGDRLLPAAAAVQPAAALLRPHLQNLGLALPDAMATLRSRPAGQPVTPTSFGWSDILIEQPRHLPRRVPPVHRPGRQAASGTFTGSSPAPAAPDPSDHPLRATSLQDLSRRLGVSYDDLTVPGLEFINPNAALVPRCSALRRRSRPCRTCTTTWARRSPSRPASSAPAGRPRRHAVRRHHSHRLPGGGRLGHRARRVPAIMNIITISEPGGASGDCSGAELPLGYADPDTARPS